MNEVHRGDFLEKFTENHEFGHTVMRSIIDEMSSDGIKTENADHCGGQTSVVGNTVLMNNVPTMVQLETVKMEYADGREKGLNAATQMKKDGGSVHNNNNSKVVGGIPANLKDMELVRDDTGMFKCICCWKVLFLFNFRKIPMT